jgi:glycosyltransferase involved in cell wall biosynthesis
MAAKMIEGTTKKIRIMYCITKGNWGGAQRYVYDLATSLPKEAYDVCVLIGSEGLLEQKLQESGIKTIVLGSLTRNIKLYTDFIALIKLIKIFKKEKPDIIHLNSSKMGLLGALAGRLAGVPKIVFTGHGWAFNEERSNLQRKIIYLFHRLTISLAHLTIAVSQATKNQIAKNKAFGDKVIVIHNSIEEINFLDKKPAKEEITKKLSQGLNLENKLWLGTISELHKNKGLKYIIEALHLLDIKTDNKTSLPILIIIGEGEERHSLQQMINTYDLQKSIFLVGRIDEAAKYLKAFDVFTLTSTTEALPYVILEAGQAGLPIIASAVGGIPEIIEDMENGILVRAKEPEEIKKALEFLINNKDKMSEFGNKIKAKINKDFTKDKMVNKTIEVYK